MADQPTVLPDGARQWRRNGVLHRDGDLPATINRHEDREWWQNGRLHRAGDRPAVVLSYGRREWCRHGRPHPPPRIASQARDGVGASIDGRLPQAAVYP